MPSSKLSALHYECLQNSSNLVLNEELLNSNIIEKWRAVFGRDVISFNSEPVLVTPSDSSDIGDTVKICGQLEEALNLPNVSVDLYFFEVDGSLECAMELDVDSIDGWHLGQCFPELPGSTSYTDPETGIVTYVSFLQLLTLSPFRFVFSSYDYNSGSGAALLPLSGLIRENIYSGLNFDGTLDLDEGVFGSLIEMMGITDSVSLPIRGYISYVDGSPIIHLFAQPANGGYIASQSIESATMALEKIEFYTSVNSWAPKSCSGIRIHTSLTVNSHTIGAIANYTIGGRSLIVSLDFDRFNTSDTNSLTNGLCGDELSEIAEIASSAFDNIAIEDLSFGISFYDGLSLDNINLELGKTAQEGETPAWEITDDLTISDPTLRLGIDNPFKATRSWDGSVSGLFLLGSGEEPPGVYLECQVPDFTIYGEMLQGRPLRLADAAENMLGLQDDFLPDLDIIDLSLGVERIEDDSVTPSTIDWYFESRMDISTNWTLPLLITDLELKGVSFELQKLTGDNGYTTGSFTAISELFDTEFLVVADKLVNGWRITGQIAPGEALLFSDIVEDINGEPVELPDGLGNLEITGLSVMYEKTSSGDNKITSFEFHTSIETTIRIGGQNFGMDLNIDYERSKELSGITVISQDKLLELRGGFNFHDVNLSLGYTRETHGTASTSSYALHYSFPLGDHNIEGSASIVKQPVNGIDHSIAYIGLPSFTLGEIIDFLCEKAGIDDRVRWDVIDNFSLSNVNLIIDLTDKSFGLNVQTDMNIGWDGFSVGQLDSVGFILRKVNGTRKVFANLSGTFLESVYPESNPLVWDVQENPPLQPNKRALLDVRYLGLGQHVALEGTGTFEKMKDVVTAMRSTAQPIVNPGNPFNDPDLPFYDSDKPTNALRYDGNSGWLIGADLTILDTLTLSGVFNDPNLYGLYIAVDGQKIPCLTGLRFEIMYQKLASGVGKFSTELTLPNKFRHIRMGVADITLPVVGMEIYTNSDFGIDIGFPASIEDFSRCGSVTIKIFIGSGGLYFKKLGSDTTSLVPSISNGEFDPVICAGLGFRFGVGKEFRAGPLRAGLSLTLNAILEGRFGWFIPSIEASQQGIQKDTYYWLSGTVGIVGKLWGVVDFKIIKADVSLTAVAAVNAILESYMPTILEFVASVKAKASVKVLFVTVNFSFTMTIRHKMTMGSKGSPQWALDRGRGQGSLPGRSLYMAKRDLKQVLLEDRKRGPLNFAVTKDVVTPEVIELVLTPAITKAQSSDQSVSTACVPMLAVKQTADTSSFNKMTTVLMRKIITDTCDLSATVSGQPCTDFVDLGDLLHIKNQLDDLESVENVLSYSQLRDVLANHFVFRITNASNDMEGAFFPMLPELDLGFDGANFSSLDQGLRYSTDDLSEFDRYFEQLHEAFAASQTKSVERSDDSLTVGEYMFQSYFVLLLKVAIQEAIDMLENYELEVTGSESVCLANLLPVIDQIPNSEMIVIANQNRQEIIRAGLEIGGHTTTVDDTFRTIAEALDITLEELSYQIDERDGLFVENATLIIPNMPGLRLDELIEKIEHQTGERNSLENAAGMISRFMLSGLRLPRPDEMSGNDDFANLETYPLFTLAGQQLDLPDDANELTVRFDTNSDYANGIDFHGEEIPGEMSSSSSDSGIKQISILLPDRDALDMTVSDHISVTQLSAYQNSKSHRPLSEAMHCNSLNQTPCSLWNLPTQACKSDSPSLVVNSFTDGSLATETSNVENYNWAASFDLNLRRQAESSVESYLVEGIEAGDMSRFMNAIDTLDANSSPELYIVYQYRTEEGIDVCQSDLLDVDKTYILQTNLSTLSHKDSLTRSVLRDPISYLAKAADLKQFLKMIWQASTVKTGGYYLRYAADNDVVCLPNEMFGQTDEVKVKLVIVMNSDNNRAPYFPLRAPLPCENCAITTQHFDLSKENLLLEDGTHMAQVYPQGYVGVEIRRNNPQNETDASQQTVDELYSLIGCRVVSDDQNAFQTSPVGIPISPVVE